ncbi:7-carboxy-7-deazaguanine synthase QueE [Streptomyces sp. NPDC055103]
MTSLTDTPSFGKPAELLVSEIFGPTFQGEGTSLGTLAGFLRLWGCNLACAERMPCDTPYTWDTTRFPRRENSAKRTLAEVGDELSKMDAELIVISGGEPLLQQKRLVPLVHHLIKEGKRVEFETNGTIAPARDLLIDGVRFNVSPKLSNAGGEESRRIVPEALSVLSSSGRAVFKFVVERVEDLDEVQQVVDSFGLSPVFVMPEGTSPDDVIRRGRELADPVIARGWSMTTRLHILLWKDERGR